MSEKVVDTLPWDDEIPIRKLARGHTTLAKNIRMRWKKWQRRAALYQALGELGVSHTSTKELLYKNNLQKACEAYQDLGKDEMSELGKLAILQLIEIQLYKLEVAQLHALQKKQHIPRKRLNTTVSDLYKKRNAFRKEMEDLIIPLSKFIPPESKKARAFFRDYEKKLHINLLSKHTSEKAHDALDAVSSGSQLITSVGHSTSHAFQSTAQGIGALLQAIPVIAAVTAAIPMIIDAYRAWVKTKSIAMRATTTTFALLAIGAAITAGLAPIAQTGLMIGIVVLGIVANHISPLIRIQHAIHKKTQEINAIDARNQQLQAGSFSNFEERENHILIRKVEKLWMKRNNQTHKDLQLIREFLNGKNTSNHIEQAVLSDYLIAENEKFKKNLQVEIAELKYQRIKTIAGTVNSFVSLAGVLMLLFPPTMIAGAAIIAGTTVVSLCLKYDVIPKLNKFRQKLFQNAAKQPALFLPGLDTLTSTPKIALEFSHGDMQKAKTAIAPRKPTVMSSNPHPTASPTREKIVEKMPGFTPSPPPSSPSKKH